MELLAFAGEFPMQLVMKLGFAIFAGALVAAFTAQALPMLLK